MVEKQVRQNRGTGLDSLVCDLKKKKKKLLNKTASKSALREKEKKKMNQSLSCPRHDTYLDCFVAVSCVLIYSCISSHWRVPVKPPPRQHGICLLCFEARGHKYRFRYLRTHEERCPDDTSSSPAAAAGTSAPSRRRWFSNPVASDRCWGCPDPGRKTRHSHTRRPVCSLPPGAVFAV